MLFNPMPQYVVSQEVNGKEYYLENIYSDNKVVWVTNPLDAITFQDEKELKDFIQREFPGKNYIPKPIHKIAQQNLIKSP